MIAQEYRDVLDVQGILNLGDRAFEQLLDGRNAPHLHSEFRQHLLGVIRLPEESSIDHRHNLLIQKSEPGDRQRGCGHRYHYVCAFSQAVDSRQPASGQQEAEDCEHNDRLNNDEPARDQKVAHAAPKNQPDGDNLVADDRVCK